jgi:peptide deformylase
MLQIITDQKLLSRKSKKVASIDDTVRNICKSLIDTMLQSNGVGIAAPQCGILKRIIIVTVQDTIKSFINPDLLEVSDETETCAEGCLSIPNESFEITRPTKIKVKYRNLKGHPMCENYSGFDARVILHEIDHLNGVLIN